MEREPKIVAKNICKSFPRKKGNSLRVLDNLSLEVRPCEFAVLLGPSGCGKSTVLRIVAGLDQADSGEILVDGAPITGPSRGCGMVFQSYTSFPWLTVLENVLFGLRLTGKPFEEQKEIAHRHIGFVGLQGFEYSYPNQLSGGMRQRVAIARTLAVEPDILLMDEPFGALDSQTRSLMHELLLDIWDRDHKTVLFVTHDIEEAVFLADDIYICSARPAVIKTEMKVEFERPRSFELRTEPKFNELKHDVLSVIREEAIRAGEETA